MTASEAQALAAASGRPNQSAINAQAQRYRNAVKDAAAKGLFVLTWADVSPLRMPITAAEKEAARQLLVADGYTVDAVGIAWNPPAE